MKESIRKHLEKYQTELMQAPETDIQIIRERFAIWYEALSEEDKASTQPFWQGIRDKARKLIEEIKLGIEELQTLQNEK